MPQLSSVTQDDLITDTSIPLTADGHPYFGPAVPGVDVQRVAEAFNLDLSGYPNPNRPVFVSFPSTTEPPTEAELQLQDEALVGHYVDMFLRAINEQRYSVLIQQAHKALGGDPDPERSVPAELANDLYVRYVAARHSTPTQGGDPDFHAAADLTPSQQHAAAQRYRRELSEMILFDGRIRTAGVAADHIAEAIKRLTPEGHRKGASEQGTAPDGGA